MTDLEIAEEIANHWMASNRTPLAGAIVAARIAARTDGARAMRERAAKVVIGQMLGQSRSRRNELMRLIADMINLLPTESTE